MTAGCRLRQVVITDAVVWAGVISLLLLISAGPTGRHEAAHHQSQLLRGCTCTTCAFGYIFLTGRNTVVYPELSEIVNGKERSRQLHSSSPCHAADHEHLALVQQAQDVLSLPPSWQIPPLLQHRPETPGRLHRRKKQWKTVAKTKIREGSEVITKTHSAEATGQSPSPTCFLANSRHSLPFSCSTLSTLVLCLPTALFLRLT